MCTHYQTIMIPCFFYNHLEGTAHFQTNPHGSTDPYVKVWRGRNSLKRSDSMCPTSSISLTSIRCFFFGRNRPFLSVTQEVNSRNMILFLWTIHEWIWSRNMIEYDVDTSWLWCLIISKITCSDHTSVFAVSMMQLLQILLLCDMGPTNTRSAKQMDTVPNILNTNKTWRNSLQHQLIGGRAYFLYHVGFLLADSSFKQYRELAKAFSWKCVKTCQNLWRPFSPYCRNLFHSLYM